MVYSKTTRIQWKGVTLCRLKRRQRIQFTNGQIIEVVLLVMMLCLRIQSTFAFVGTITGSTQRRQQQPQVLFVCHNRGCRRTELSLLQAVSTNNDGGSSSGDKTDIVVAVAAVKNLRKQQSTLKITNTNNNRQQHEESVQKKKSMSKYPPEFLQLNTEITTCCETAQDTLNLLASRKNALTGLAGGGAVNTVNFSTAIHRMSRAMAYNVDDRKATLSNPKYALFICAISEAFAGMDYTQPLSSMANGRPLIKGPNTLKFGSREISNMVWALAKVKIVPPQSALPVDLTEQVLDDLVAISFKLRTQVLESVQTRQSNNWIPTLSLLSAKLMDAVSYQLLAHPFSANNNSDQQNQEIANLLWALSTSKRATEPVFASILKSFKKSLDRKAPKPQEFSNSIWAIATSEIYAKGHEIVIERCADLLDGDEKCVKMFKPQELSNIAWGLATMISNKRQDSKLSSTLSTSSPSSEDLVALRILRHVARQLIVRADDFKSQELSNSLWAFGTLGFGVTQTEAAIKMTMNDYVFLKSDDVEGDKDLMARAVDAVAKSSLPRLEKFREMELNNLAYALARLERKEYPELLKGIANQFGHHWRQKFDGQDIGTTMWAFATLEYFDADSFRMIASKIRLDRINKYRPQELSNMVWAAATASVVPKYLDAFDTSLVSKRPSFASIQDDPITVMFAVAAKELMNRPEIFKTQEIKDTLWAFSKIGLRHPILFKSVAEHLVGLGEVPVGQLHCGRGMQDFSPQGMGNLLWSYAKQAQLSEGANPDINGRLAIYCRISVDVGEMLIKRLTNCAADTSLQHHDGLSKFKTNDISNMVWATATLGIRHGRFFDTVANQVMERAQDFLSGRRNGITTFTGQELTNIIWACASVNFKKPMLLDAISKYAVKQSTDKYNNFNAKTIARYFKRQELANLAWACAVMGHYPKDLLRLCYRGLFGEGDEQDPTYMTKVHGDEGLQSHAIMSMLYVQMAMDIDTSMNELSLPANFPVGWDMSGGFTLNSDDDVNQLLNLTTSGIQNKVSRTLKRIGFRHVEEHVISTEELVKNHGVKLLGTPVDVLSIDIADPVRKIGVEVDGPGHFIHVLDTWSPQEPALGFARILNGRLEYQFLWDDRMDMNGSTALKQRLLAKLGWHIKHLPFWKWHALQGNHQKEEEYCEKLMNEASE